MRTLRLSYIAVLCLPLMILSCTKSTESQCGEAGDGEMISLNIRALMGSTKVTDISKESEIESLEAFVFVGGRLQACGYSEGDNVTIRCYSGAISVVAIANYPEIPVSDDIKEEYFDVMVCDLPLDESRKVMCGRQSFITHTSHADETTFSNVGIELEIDMYRMVSRFAMCKITNNTGKNLTINGIYVINAPGDAELFAALYSSTYPPAIWYNRSVNAGEGGESLSSGDLNISLSADDSYETPHYFYCCPNPTAVDTFVETIDGSEWLPRYTRLVVEAVLNGEVSYYPITFGGTKSNYSYEVTNLTITGLGAVNPDNGPFEERVPVPIGFALGNLGTSDPDGNVSENLGTSDPGDRFETVSLEGATVEMKVDFLNCEL